MTILIVEDTKTISSLLQVYLMGLQLEFVEVSNGKEGYEKARELQPALIISDVRMPVMDGFELCASVRADPELANTPIVLLTSLTDDASRRKGKLVGASAMLHKPVAVDELRRTVNELLQLES